MSLTGSPRLDHVAITVTDLERSLDFYTRLLGLRHLETQPVGEKIVYRLFGLTGVRVVRAELSAGLSEKLELYHFEHCANTADKYGFDRVGIQHLAFRVRDLDEAGKRLELAGVEVVSEPVSVANGTRSAFIRDPDGTIVELVESPFSFTAIGRMWLFLSKTAGRFLRSREAVLGTSISRQAQK